MDLHILVFHLSSCSWRILYKTFKNYWLTDQLDSSGSIYCIYLWESASWISHDYLDCCRCFRCHYAIPFYLGTINLQENLQNQWDEIRKHETDERDNRQGKNWALWDKSGYLLIKTIRLLSLVLCYMRCFIVHLLAYSYQPNAKAPKNLLLLSLVLASIYGNHNGPWVFNLWAITCSSVRR